MVVLVDFTGSVLCTTDATRPFFVTSTFSRITASGLKYNVNPMQSPNPNCPNSFTFGCRPSFFFLNILM